MLKWQQCPCRRGGSYSLAAFLRGMQSQFRIFAQKFQPPQWKQAGISDKCILNRNRLLLVLNGEKSKTHHVSLAELCILPDLHDRWITFVHTREVGSGIPSLSCTEMLLVGVPEVKKKYFKARKYLVREGIHCGRRWMFSSWVGRTRTNTCTWVKVAL